MMGTRLLWSHVGIRKAGGGLKLIVVSLCEEGEQGVRPVLAGNSDLSLQTYPSMSSISHLSPQQSI